jgi:hypothetical protein
VFLFCRDTDKLSLTLSIRAFLLFEHFYYSSISTIREFLLSGHFYYPGTCIIRGFLLLEDFYQFDAFCRCYELYQFDDFYLFDDFYFQRCRGFEVEVTKLAFRTQNGGMFAWRCVRSALHKQRDRILV